MSYATLDDDLAEGLLRGDLPPDAVPSGYRHLAALVRAARGPAVESELTSEAAVVGAAVAAIRSTLPATPRHDPVSTAAARRRRVPGRLVAAATAGAVILGGSAAAAATDSLPGPAQTAVSDALSHVGISVPKPNAHANRHALDHSGHSGAAPGHQGGHGSGPAVQPGSPAEFGLCTAFLAGSQGATSGNRNSSTAFAALIAAHGGSVGTTTTYCQGVVAAHPGDSQSEGTGDVQGGPPSGSGPAPGGQRGAGSSSSTGSPSPPGANGLGGGNGTGAGHPAPATTPATTGASTSSTVNGHSRAGSAQG